MHEVAAPGVIVVRYRTGEELDPDRQGEVVARLEHEATHGPTAVVFVVGPLVRTVELSVPTFWLEATRAGRLRLAALAVVSRNPGVRVATAGFGAANVVRGARFRVKGFDAEHEAVAWARAALTGAAGGGAPPLA